VTSAIQWRKEFRELVPFWAATVSTMAVCWALMHPDLMPTDRLYNWARSFERDILFAIEIIAYAAGTVTLGAVSIGNEYAHDTLPQLLVQPAARGQVLRVKLIVLGLMLTALGVAAAMVWIREPEWAGIAGYFGKLVLVAGPPAAGLLLAPWLTMVGRSALGGAAFTAVLPALFWLGAASVRLPSALLYTAGAAVAVLGLVMTWRTFVRLEVVGSGATDTDLSTWFSGSQKHASARTQDAIWLMVKKELRLHQGAVVVAGLYVAVWLAVVVDRFFELKVLPNSPMFVATFVNSLFVPLLCGAVASASERQFGVSDWQTLLPIAAWKQWVIKAGVALGMTFALAVMLPALLSLVRDETGWRDGLAPTTVLMLCAAALYVSTLSSNSLRALLATVPATAAAIVTAVVLWWLIGDIAEAPVRWLAQALPIEMTQATFSWWMRRGIVWLAAGSMVVLLAFAHANHRTADRGSRRLATQFAWLMSYAMASVLVLAVISWLHMKGRIAGGH
jgi:hypothetical protein